MCLKKSFQPERACKKQVLANKDASPFLCCFVAVAVVVVVVVIAAVVAVVAAVAVAAPVVFVVAVVVAVAVEKKHDLASQVGLCHQLNLLASPPKECLILSFRLDKRTLL